MTADRELIRLLGTRFVQRRDVKAVQATDGSWRPIRSPFTMQDFRDHLSGERTFGHYLLDTESNCKLFAFDIDLVKREVCYPRLTCQGSDIKETDEQLTGVPRSDYTPKNPAFETLMISLRVIAEGLARKVADLGIGTAIASSGHKGLHVYGFTDSVQAEVAQGLAIQLLTDYGCFEPTRGNNFWKHTDLYPMLEIEVFPKQTSLDEGGLGNLMSLPLGRHQVTGRKKFFVSTNSTHNRLLKMDPTRALGGDAPWE